MIWDKRKFALLLIVFIFTNLLYSQSIDVSKILNDTDQYFYVPNNSIDDTNDSKIELMLGKKKTAATTTKETRAEKKARKEAELEAKIAANKFFVVFDYGAASTWITRLKLQTTRSNFVFDDFLVGAYFSAETRNMLKYMNLLGKVAVYYPLSYKFNRHPQLIAQPLAFAADVTLGPLFRVSIKDVLFVKLTPGFHYLFQKSDRFIYSNIGVTGIVGLELPLARRWGIFLNGQASYDWGNFGSNKVLEEYDHVWQYQVSVGVRYTKRGRYDRSYIGMIVDAIKNGKAKKAAKTTSRKESKSKSKVKK